MAETESNFSFLRLFKTLKLHQKISQKGIQLLNFSVRRLFVISFHLFYFMVFDANKRSFKYNKLFWKSLKLVDMTYSESCVFFLIQHLDSVFKQTIINYSTFMILR